MSGVSAPISSGECESKTPRYLERTLRSLREYTAYPAEYLHLLVVDDMSSPENRAQNARIAAEMGATYLHFATRRSFNEVLAKAAGLLEGRVLVYLEHDWEFFWRFDWVTPALGILDTWPDVGQVLLKLEEGAWELPEFLDPERRLLDPETWALLPRDPGPMAPHGYSFQPHVIRRETFLEILETTPEFVPRYLEPAMGARFHELGLRTAWINGYGFAYHFGQRSAHDMDVELAHLDDPARLESYLAYMRRGF